MIGQLILTLLETTIAVAFSASIAYLGILTGHYASSMVTWMPPLI